LAYPDLSFRSVLKHGARGIVMRSLFLLVSILAFTQWVNYYLSYDLVGAERIANMILSAKITLIVAIPFVFYVVILQARSDLAAQYFRSLSRTDPLTGLLNRRAFLDLLKSRKRRQYTGRHESDALLVIDLDHFKQVNDRFGHEAGDAILRQVADLFLCNLRNDDVIARFGGEEFAIALNRVRTGETQQVAQRLRMAVEDHVFLYEGEEIRITISIGLARFGAGQKLESALRQADLLTYQSKKDGRNRVSSIEEQDSSSRAA
jgi:diguanylate cyclase (GGDEF)-like protein